MAKTRAIRKRIISVRNIYKITRTMERVAQSKVMKLTGRLAHANGMRDEVDRFLPVALGADLGSVRAAQELELLPLTAHRAPIKKVLLFCVTSSRGLCGGYNSRVIGAAKERMAGLRAEGREPELAVMGRKGLAYFRFYNQPVLIPLADTDENLPFSFIDETAVDIMARYLRGEFDGVEVISTRYKTKMVQHVRRSVLLPFAPSAERAQAAVPKVAALGAAEPYLREPSRSELLEVVLPMAVTLELFCTVLEAFLCEHAQRAVAMHSASDNAQSMIKTLTLTYNRARQAQITNEMIEIVSGSEGSRK